MGVGVVEKVIDPCRGHHHIHKTVCTHGDNFLQTYMANVGDDHGIHLFDEILSMIGPLPYLQNSFHDRDPLQMGPNTFPGHVHSMDRDKSCMSPFHYVRNKAVDDILCPPMMSTHRKSQTVQVSHPQTCTTDPDSILTQ